MPAEKIPKNCHKTWFPLLIKPSINQTLRSIKHFRIARLFLIDIRWFGLAGINRLVKLCSSRKYPDPHHGGNRKFRRGGGVNGPGNSKGEGVSRPNSLPDGREND